MKQNLSELTMREYIDLICGDFSVLKSPAEVASPTFLEEVRKRLMFEYMRLSDKGGTRSYLGAEESKVKAQMEYTLFRVLSNLMQLNQGDAVREILGIYGLRRPMTDEQLSAEVKRLMNRAETTIKRLKQESEEVKAPTSEDIRESYDQQTASLMTYFKFQIDLATIPATQYACMIAQANREIKAKMAAYAKK